MKGLYLITPDWDDTEQLLAATEQGLLGGASLVQYRHKTAPEALRAEQAESLLKLCRRYQRPLIINDHIDLCAALDADGVHVGGTDEAIEQVRARVGTTKIVGASCYGQLALATHAARAGASYVAFGGFYPSRVKKYEVSTPISIVTEALQALTLPICVIGGMTVDNAKPLVDLGAHMVAAISSVYSTNDHQAAASAFTALFR